MHEMPVAHIKNEAGETRICNQRDVAKWEEKGWKRFTPLGTPVKPAGNQPAFTAPDLTRIFTPKGDMAFCDRKQIKRLVDKGWTLETPKQIIEREAEERQEAEAESKAEERDGEEERDFDAILAEAIPSLDPENDDHWTSQDKPRLTALREMTGLEVTRRDVDRVFPGFVRPQSPQEDKEADPFGEVPV